MDKPNAKQQEIIDRNIRVLEELEKKYGVAWVKKTYENAPALGSKFFELATKRHAVYHYRKNGKTGDVEQLVKILEKKIIFNTPTEAKTAKPTYKNNSLSPQLEGSLAALNGIIGKTVGSVEEFYVRWLTSKERKIHKQKIKKLVDEAVEKKAEVLVKIAGFYRNRNKKDEYGVVSELKNGKKEKANIVRVPARKQRLNEKRVDLSQVTLSTEQKELFDLLEKTNHPIFLTGKAGTGKSLLLQYFRQKSAKKIVVCASTGVAALNVGGQTIHSLFRIAPGFTREGTLKGDKKVESLLKHVDTVVIDEVSMVSPDLMDAIDQRLRQAKKTTVPFGGTQIVMFGDLYQLPPVMSDKDLQKYFEETYGGYFFFNAHVWQNIDFEIRELTNIFRQKNEDFREILNAVREGTITDEQLAELNKRSGLITPDAGIIMLATTNYAVAKVNKEKLSQLKEKEYEYKAAITGNLEPSAFPTEETLCLKKGAQVMLLKNDKEKRWVNGTIGYVQSLDENEIKVTIDGITHSIPKETWQKVRYYYDQTKNKIDEEVVSSFEQFPLRLAWAITIHKSQGQTYTAVAIDMGSGAFAHGQAYVALSRCTTLDGLFLKREILRKDIIVESKISDFMRTKKAGSSKKSD